MSFVPVDVLSSTLIFVTAFAVSSTRYVDRAGMTAARDVDAGTSDEPGEGKDEKEEEEEEEGEEEECTDSPIFLSENRPNRVILIESDGSDSSNRVCQESK